MAAMPFRWRSGTAPIRHPQPPPVAAVPDPPQPEPSPQPVAPGLILGHVVTLWLDGKPEGITHPSFLTEEEAWKEWRHWLRPDARRDASARYEVCEIASAGTVAVAKVKAQGQQRAAMTTCMTCWDSARRNRAWDDDPVDCLIRGAERHRWPGRNRQNEVDGFRDEVLAIAALIEAHQEEFDDLLAGLGDTVRLDKARAAKRARRSWQG